MNDDVFVPRLNTLPRHAIAPLPRAARTSWWTVAEGGAAFQAALTAERQRIAHDPHAKMPDLTHLVALRRGAR